ncbi:MAG: dihydrolipoyl dehydrogenase [Neisseriaceae bacterium]|nr:dihydrolipoyl dehydrogenase [Neisseriaceae bacterium]
MANQFDVAVIGGGPGGYVAAIRAAQLGFKTVCIDAGKNKAGDAPALGGTCLNVGCIPSKALLQSSEHFHTIQHELSEHGISAGKPTIDVAKMIERKDGIVNKLTSGIAFLFKKNKVESIHGVAAFAGQDNGKWLLNINGEQTISATHVIVATGSIPRPLPNVEVDNKTVLDNVGALNQTAIPKKLCLIGSGVIGLEMGSVWNRLGSEVTVLEALPNFMPMADSQLATEAFKVFTKEQGLNILLGVKIDAVKNNGKNVEVTFTTDGNSQTQTFDKLIVAIGRIPNTDGLNTEVIGLAKNERGFIEVDDECRTNLPNIWAIGDVVRGPMLAHKASEEGVAVAERIAGQKPHVNLDVIPSVVYTTPEMAWVGKTEEQLKSAGIEYRKGQSTFAANGRALGLGQAKGFVKMLVDDKTDRILGVHMIGPMVSELISEAVVAMEFSASGEDIARIIHAHPTLSEVIHEAALASDKRALHG